MLYFRLFDYSANVTIGPPFLTYVDAIRAIPLDSTIVPIVEHGAIAPPLSADQLADCLLDVSCNR